MIYIFIFIIATLAVAIVGLTIRFVTAKREHAKKVNEMEHTISELDRRNLEQLDKVVLCDELSGTLQTARTTIDSDLIAMQRDFLEILSKNNLVE